MPKDLMDKTTNQIIHEWLRGGCAHDAQFCRAGECIASYTSDLNAVREAELKAIEEFGQFKYLDALYLVMFGTVDAQTIVTDLKQRVNMITAPASVRAQAIRKLVEENNG